MLMQGPEEKGKERGAPIKTKIFTRRLLWLLWVASFACFISICLTPVSNRMTRSSRVALLFLWWFGLIFLVWRRPIIQFALLGLTGLVICFLFVPGRPPSPGMLRRDYVNGLEHYRGVPYYWGGESFKGIDCSGLIRRGLIDSLFCRGMVSVNPALVRYAIWLWWHDCSASDLGEGNLQMTVHVLDTPSLNRLDHSQILPGDLAVTAGGVHIMAYKGSNTWIEADPGAKRVVVVTAPCRTNAWFTGPMQIMRWQILHE
jgi:hypothetical protein